MTLTPSYETYDSIDSFGFTDTSTPPKKKVSTHEAIKPLVENARVEKWKEMLELLPHKIHPKCRPLFMISKE